MVRGWGPPPLRPGALPHHPPAPARLRAPGATVLTGTSFLVTRFGNVPINARIKEWAVTSPPADYVEILQRWDLFNQTRTITALAAFVLLVIAQSGSSPRPALSPTPSS
ncbi:anthrone oxygenase family protein [Streptomyces sp. NPDC059443]|uniref:anthrone oxygenase family protein n=1 Tax=Streptomyces sp. NPDC059443 TaxID=3346831 RepID=UPI0036858F0A